MDRLNLGANPITPIDRAINFTTATINEPSVTFKTCREEKKNGGKKKKTFHESCTLTNSNVAVVVYRK